VDVRDDIMIHLSEIERNVNWLAIKTGYSYNTLYSYLKKKSFELTDTRLKKINKVFGTKFNNTKQVD